ncbi:PREDICTED: probable LRR receptor-like serine/threonine-protein kinase At1g53430 [Populus euphratica]|uniref:non-specific serine/threonine protein kinase n=1 Tax=Populus euphratica TaxID=75702 RepID=A0AAJ6T224_POPEU|nr:PREDICTED: probable LRR receptor-like serine/threonine-protein kinase At1g53430 [Populus euphratica]
MAFVESLSKTASVFVFGFVLLNCFVVEKFRSHAQEVTPLLPHDEVQILQTISDKLKNNNWTTIDRTSCSSAQWKLYISDPPKNDRIQSNVTCDCTFENNTVCHVISFKLKGFNLTGVLPVEFRNLTQLLEIDLSRNYLNGSIPGSLAELPNLQSLSLLANRLSGSIPREIGSFTTLKSLVLEDNLLGGSLHPDLGNLKSLERLLLSANNFSGTIPDTFGNLKNLNDFRIDGSELSGKIPDFIGNWTNITTLDLQGTSMEGPIPSTISLLKELTILRISDLKGSSSTFPDLKYMTKMEKLILRNCSMTGSIPEYLGNMADLDTLDLSFNKLTGQIPGPLESLTNIKFMFLNNNLLTGEVPAWILESRKELDLSYNNFTGSAEQSCQQLPVNLVSSHVSTGSNKISWCLNKDLVCTRKSQYHSLFINCGGSSETVGDNEYEDDTTTGGAAEFASISERWGYSSTGTHIGNDDGAYKATNSYGLNVTGEGFYRTARLAPQSLKYYGLCMLAGSYKVQLHFAEIMFSNNQTFSSLGRRIFDISIQGKVVEANFNIMEEAGGVGIGITKVFDGIIVNGSTLEIHLYWSGKGTTAVPDRGVYGPLISAITVTPNFKVDNGGGLSVGAIIGIVAAPCVLAALVLLVLRKKGYLGGKDLEDKELRALDLQTGYFSLRQIKHATNNFDPANKIGEGGFGPVYKGMLSDGSVIAVKQLSAKSKQGNREFVNEIGMISALQHPHLVKLYGCCIEGNQLLLVYEYLENNSLARALFGRDEHQIKLDWQTRKKILLGIAKGLAYLHEESRLKIVHRDIKATNVLLDKDLNAKISDFGLAKLDEEENTHISTRIAGTIGYMAPEYAMRGYLTDKADVYSFGVVVLEIVSGKSNTNYRPKEEFVYLLDWAYVLQEQGNLLELVDPSLGSSYSKIEALRILNLALLCTNPSPTLRPSMSSAVKMLEGQIPVQAPIVKRSTMDQDARFKAFELLSHDSQTHVSNGSQSSQIQKSISMDGPWMDSEFSIQSKDEIIDSSSTKLLKDLYDVNLD